MNHTLKKRDFHTATMYDGQYHFLDGDEVRVFTPSEAQRQADELRETEGKLRDLREHSRAEDQCFKRELKQREDTITEMAAASKAIEAERDAIKRELVRTIGERDAARRAESGAYAEAAHLKRQITNLKGQVTKAKKKGAAS
jgi:hypothetical protein